MIFDPMSTSIQTDDITKSVLNDKYSIEVHAYTGIEVLKVKGHEGNGSWIMKSGDQQQLDFQMKNWLLWQTEKKLKINENLSNISEYWHKQ